MYDVLECVCIDMQICRLIICALHKFVITDSSRHLFDYTSPWILQDLYFIVFILCTIHKRFTTLNKHNAQTSSLDICIIISQYYYMFWSAEITGDHQCRFWRNRSANDHIICIGQILEKKWEYNEAVHQLFIDFKKASDSVRREVSYNILIESGITLKLARQIKMCLNETCSRVWVGKHLYDMFHIRNDLKNKEMFYRYCFSTLL